MICPEMRLQDCVLQLSCDGGATWTDVPGWSAGFSGCVTSVITPPVPPNPGGGSADTRACNLAGYLAKEFIQKTMRAAYTVINGGLDQLAFAKDIATLIAFPFPLTYIAINALYDVFNYWEGQSLAEINAASSDALLWSDVTCAIYSAIKTVGYVNATNFTAVATNLAGITYTYSWVAPSLHNFWNELGLTNIQGLQDVGALDVVDCSACRPPVADWCYEFDFTASDGGWSILNADAVYTPGVGWQSVHDVTNNWQACQIGIAIPARSIIAVEMEGFANSPTDQVSSRGTYDNCGSVWNSLANDGTGPIVGRIPVVCTQSFVYCRLDSHPYIAGMLNTISKVRVYGNGSNPFGTSNCPP